MEMLQGVWKQHLRPRAVVGYGVKIFLPSPPDHLECTQNKLCILKMASSLVSNPKCRVRDNGL